MLIRIIDPFWTKHTFVQSRSCVRKIQKPPIATLRDTENSSTRLWSPRINVEPEKLVSQSMPRTKVVVDTVVSTSNACVDIRSCVTAQCPTGGSSPTPIRQTRLPIPTTVRAHAEEAVVLGSVTGAHCSFDTNTPCADKATETVDSAFTLSAADFMHMHTLTDDVVAIEYVMVEADLDTPLSTGLESGIDCTRHNTTCTSSSSTVSTNTEPRVTMDHDNDALLIFTDFSFCADSFVLID